MRRLAGFLMIILGILQGIWIAYNLFVKRLPQFQEPLLPMGLTALAGGLITVGSNWLRKPHPGKMGETEYTCPCCGYKVFSGIGDYEICPICFWEDDIVQLRFPSLEGGANDPNLIQAQKNFTKFGAMEERFKSNVRESNIDDIKDPDWRTISQDDILEKPIGKNEELIPYPDDSTTLYYWSDRYWLKKIH